MRTKVTLVLLFLNVALFFFIFRFERMHTDEDFRNARRRVLGAEAADIRSLTISTTGGSTLAFTKRGDTWFITKPLDWPANPNAVSRITNELQFLEHETSFNVADLAKNGQSVSDYGVDHPKMTVTFSAGTSPGENRPPSITTLRIGDTTKDGLRLYLLSPDGERIHVVSQSLSRTLALTFEEARADTILTIPVFEARSLNLQTAAPASLRIRLRRDGSRWSFETPIIARASKTATETTIGSLDALRLKSFVTQNPPSSLPSDNPRLRISLEGNNRRETLVLGDKVDPASNAPDAEYYAQLEGRDALFTVVLPYKLKTTLDQAQDKLRETRLFDFDPRAVTAITLTAPNVPDLTLQRLVETGAQSVENQTWQIVRRGNATQGPQITSADRDVVQRLLDQFSQLTAQQFKSDAPRDADLESWGFNRPEREVALTLAGAAAVTLQVGLPTQRDGFAYARLPANSPSVYAIDPELLRETPMAPRAWRDRLLRQLPAGAHLTALKLTRIEGDVPLYVQRLAAGQTWAGALAAEPAARRAAVQTVLAQLGTLRAKEFVLDQYADHVNVASEDRPWLFRLDAAITLTGGTGEQTSTTTLFLTQRVGGDRQLAGSPSAEFDAVFAIEQPLLDALWTLTEGPRDPGPATPTEPAPAPKGPEPK